MLLRRVALQVIARWLMLKTFGEAEGIRGKVMLALKTKEKGAAER